MLVLVAATAARYASGDGGDPLLVGSTATALAPETFTLTPERRRLTVDLTKANVSAEHVLAMDKRATGRLPEMKHDAETVRACDVSQFANAPGVAPISGAPSFHATSDTEVFVCPAARLAFIHIFKCAGTTLIASMHDLCRATYGDEGFCVTTGAPWVCRGGPTRTMEEEWANIQSYTWFTFVREPVSKFESGIFELARRNGPCVLGAGATSEGDQLALDVLDSCVLSTERREEVDPHLRPSINYLLEPDGSVTPLLAYVGRVETFVDDWPALVTKFFDATKGAQVRELILNDQLHERDSEGEIYSSDCPPKFNLEIASESAKAKVAQAFRADEVCLGYADQAPARRSQWESLPSAL